MSHVLVGLVCPQLSQSTKDRVYSWAQLGASCLACTSCIADCCCMRCCCSCSCSPASSSCCCSGLCRLLLLLLLLLPMAEVSSAAAVVCPVIPSQIMHHFINQLASIMFVTVADDAVWPLLPLVPLMLLLPMLITIHAS